VFLNTVIYDISSFSCNSFTVSANDSHDCMVIYNTNHYNANVTQVKKIQHYQVCESWLFLMDPTCSSTVGKKWSRYRPGVAQRVGRGIALLFHDRGTTRGWVVSSTPRPHFTPGKDPVPILQEAEWAPGPVWTGRKSRPHRDSIPGRPARNSVAIPTELPGPLVL
jgi:hypothetical protein